MNKTELNAWVKVKLSELKLILMPYKFYVWLAAITPIFIFTSGFTSFFALMFQASAYASMYLIGWNDIFKGFDK